jgi:hypothetical protein
LADGVGVYRPHLCDCRQTAPQRGLQPEVTNNAGRYFGGANIAEGSTGQTDIEQARFLGMALRSLVETVACQHLINRRQYLPDAELLRQAYRKANDLSAKLQAFRKSIAPEQAWIREETAKYLAYTVSEPEILGPFKSS